MPGQSGSIIASTESTRVFYVILVGERYLLFFLSRGLYLNTFMEHLLGSMLRCAQYIEDSFRPTI